MKKIIIIVLSVIVLISVILLIVIFKEKPTVDSKKWYNDESYMCKYVIDNNRYYEYYFKVKDNKIDFDFCNLSYKFDDINDFYNDDRVIRYKNGEDLATEATYIYEDTYEIKISDSFCDDLIKNVNYDKDEWLDNYILSVEKENFKCEISNMIFE